MEPNLHLLPHLAGLLAETEAPSEAGRFDVAAAGVAQNDLWRQIIDPALGIGAFMRPRPPELIVLDELGMLAIDRRAIGTTDHLGIEHPALDRKAPLSEVLPGMLPRNGRPADADMPAVVKELKDVGLSATDAWEIWQEGWDGVDSDNRPTISGGDSEAVFLRYVKEKIDLLKRRKAAGRVENSTGFLLEAIKKNYANPEFTAAEKQREAQRWRETKASRERKHKRLRDKKINLERERRDEVHVLCKEMFSASPDLAEEVAKELLQDESWFKKQYEPGRSALENYQKVSLLWIEMDRCLEERHPERFRTIQEKYDGQLGAIDQKIRELEEVREYAASLYAPRPEYITFHRI